MAIPKLYREPSKVRSIDMAIAVPINRIKKLANALTKLGVGRDDRIAVGHPDVIEAAVIGLAHPKWGERALLVVVARKDGNVSKADLLSFIEPKVTKIWLPDDVVLWMNYPTRRRGKYTKPSQWVFIYASWS